jgi:hypothetical protein
LTVRVADLHNETRFESSRTMAVTFPSEGFFQALAAAMAAEHDRFRALGFFDATIGIRVLPDDGAGDEQLYVLGFEVFECTVAEKVPSFAAFKVDFVLEGRLSAWREMFENIRRNGGADVAHTINTLTHFGEQLRLRYDDPDGHDKLYRFAESVQKFFDLAATLDGVQYTTTATAAPAT